MPRRTKIVCTVGPSSDGEETIDRMIQAGMNVARLNFSHGTQAEHAEKIRRLRSLAARRSSPLAILQDLAGPKIRIGPIASGTVSLVSGSTYTLTSRDVSGDERSASLTYKDLPRDVRIGETLLLADGALEFRVERVEGPDILCRVVVGGPLSSHKGINLPSGTVRAPILSEKDRSDLAFGLAQGVDCVASSFVRSAADVREVRTFMDAHGGGATPLIAKIEKHEALSALDEIMAEVDGVMVARGDLGVEIPLEQVPRAQKTLIAKANRAGKPVITATQMLRSMTDAPRPTRAEVSDVANAILEGTDAVMLSEESASGRFPVEAVSTLDRIALETEQYLPYHDILERAEVENDGSEQAAVATAACVLAAGIHAAAILVLTQSGSTARRVSRCRPSSPVIAMSPDEATLRRMALFWGTVPLYLASHPTIEELLRAGCEAARKAGHVRSGDTVVVTAGVPLQVQGITNLIKVEKIP